MKKAYVFMANGFEDIEAIGTIDILRRGGVDVKTVSITGDYAVESAHGISIEADMKFEEADFNDADALVLPGGLPGATNLNDHEGVRNALVAQAEKSGIVAAICAAPLVLGGLGLVKGKRATCYPGFEKYLDGAEYTHELCTVDGNITTGEGPGATFDFAYALLKQLVGNDTVAQLQEGMMYNHLLGK